MISASALSASRSRIAPAYGGPVIYCADAMKGLEAMGRVVDPAERETLAAEAAANTTKPAAKVKANCLMISSLRGWSATR